MPLVYFTLVVIICHFCEMTCSIVVYCLPLLRMLANDTTSKDCKNKILKIIEHRGWLNTKLMQNWGWGFSLKYCKIPHPPNWLSKNKSFRSIHSPKNVAKSVPFLIGSIRINSLGGGLPKSSLRILQNWYSQN